TILGAVMLYVCTRFIDAAVGMKWAIVVLGVISFVSAALLWIAVKDVDVNEAMETENTGDEEEKEKITAKDFLIVLKAPETWLVAIGIFCAYSFSCTMSYFTPYVTDVLGGSVALGGALAIIRQHGLKLVGAPLGGAIADKLKSPTKVLMIVYIGGIITILLFLNLPATVSMAIFIALTFVVGILAYMGKGVYYAVQNEVHIPVKYSATTIGIAAILGFSPDIFLFVLIGHWIDTYGALGYTYTFLFQIAILVVGILSALFILNRNKKLKEKSNVA
ncbi:MAG: nitrate/nitrite transporter, partial [Intestinibacter sp.]|uniref:MFS transporter n=1 Tax=Intestinibacter sp. TaxID=1965304 RepID=UPI003F17A221